MSKRNSQRKRTKNSNKFLAVLGAILLSATLFFVLFFAVDEFTMYWFVLLNQDSASERRRQEDFSWYSGNSVGTSYGDTTGSTDSNWSEEKPGLNTPNNPIFTGQYVGDPVAVMRQVEAGLSDEEKRDPMTFFRFLIYYMDSKGYVPNACIAIMANSEGEISSISGNKMGVWLYQSYYKRAGPDGNTSSVVIDNDGWYSWVEQYYGRGSGLGFFQWSDGRAMHLIEDAEAQGTYWQSIWLQITHLLEWEDQRLIWNTLESTAPGVNPKSSYDVSANEWVHRLFANEMSGGYSRWDTYDMSKNTTHNERKRIDAIEEATKIYNQYSHNDSWFPADGVNDWHNPFTGPTYDNSTPQGLLIARMALFLASGDRTLGATKVVWTQNGYNSSDLDAAKSPTLQYYREANYAVLGSANGGFWASCDAGSSTAIYLAGVDDDFQKMSTSSQHNYMQNTGVPSGKWLQVGTWGDVQMQPGDVIITKGSGHIKIWIGEQVAGERFEGSTANMYQASYKKYYPILSHESLGYDSSGRAYYVYRCINPDWSSAGWDKFMARLNELGGRFPEMRYEYPYSSQG